jgi:amidase
MLDELVELDATASAELVRSRQLSPSELVDAAIARIAAVDPQLNAVVTPLFESARKAAEHPADGPFRGVPFLLKDLQGYSAGDPHGGGMRVLREARWTPDFDSYVVEKFRAAGLVVLGRTNVPELGLNITTEPLACGPCRNPWNPGYSTGGSSGGSAAAVASGMVPVAHANDGGGSIRIPASACGLVGLKPSRGRVSLGPDRGEDWEGFVHDHVVSRSVRDSAALLDAIAGPMPGDPYAAPPPLRPFVEEVGADPGQLRIGLMPRSPRGASPCHPECSAAVEAAGRLLESLGHQVELSHPPALDEHERMLNGFSAVVAGSAARDLLKWGTVLGRRLDASDVEGGTWGLASQGSEMTAPDYLLAVGELQVWSRAVASWWARGFDLLVTPTLGAPPPPLGTIGGPADDPEERLDRILGLMSFTPQFNVTGQPAVSLPLAWSEAGLPLGVQFVAATNREDLLYRIAAQLEVAQPWAERRPPIRA